MSYNAFQMSDPIRLNKYLAHATGISRREADVLIEQGRVGINGRTAELGGHISESDLLTVDGKPVTNKKPSYTYLLLNKPVGYVCSRKSQGGDPTIYRLLPPVYHPLKPVGRLDRDSSGILLLTNDGDFAHQMTHPSFHKTKTYEVRLDHELEPLHQQMISDYGIMLEDGVSKLMIEKMGEHEHSARALGGEAPLRDSFPKQAEGEDSQRLSARESSDENSFSIEKFRGGGTSQTLLYRIIMHEGRNRQIRRTFAALGYTVTQLHRTHFGSYSLGDLQPGEITETVVL